jgi:hypothetical protein
MDEKYPKFESIPRLNRNFVISEKIDGTNGLIEVVQDTLTKEPVEKPFYSKTDGRIYVSREGVNYEVRAGSRSRWLTDSRDNFGFWQWVKANAVELTKLGQGRHYGEWYGKGIQRGYGLNEKRFMLFNSDMWGEAEKRPACCEVATVLGRGTDNLSLHVESAIEDLREHGSFHVWGYHNPEGIVVYHTAARQYFKVTLDNDGVPKSLAKVA